jgi:DNA-binding transcriptional regulator YiaG
MTSHDYNVSRMMELLEHPAVMEYHEVASAVDAFERTIKITPPTLAEAIKFRRDQSGLTQKKMAELCGIPVARYKALELGDDCGMKEARKLAAIGIPASVILG